MIIINGKEAEELIMETFKSFKLVMEYNKHTSSMPFPVLSQDLQSWSLVLDKPEFANELFNGLCVDSYNYLLDKCYELAETYNLFIKDNLKGKKVANLVNYFYNTPGLLPVGYNLNNTSGVFNQDYTHTPSVYTRHEGVDWPTPVGTPVIAQFESRVAFVENNDNGSYGKYIILQNIENQKVFYLGAHMNNIVVLRGDIIKRGQVVGTTGNTGAGTGAHFHTSTSIIPSENYNDYRFYNGKGNIRADRMVNPYDHSISWDGKIKDGY